MWRCKAYYTDENGKYTSKSFTAATKKEAEALAAQFKMDITHEKKPENKTIEALMESFIDSRSNLVSPSTLTSYYKMKRTAFQEIMEIRAGYLTQEKYQKAVNNYAKGRSPKTVLEAHRFFCTVFKLNNIPIDDKAVILPRKVKTEIMVPTTEEVRIMLEAAKEKGIYLPLLLAALMGLRKSEIFALKWIDVDLKNKMLSINKAVVKDPYGEYVEKRTTKTYSSTRKLTMPQQVIDALPAPKGYNERLFELSPDACISRFNRMREKLGMRYNFHALRHYNASIMLQKNIPNKYAMERLGHATDNMLKKVYQHTFENAHKEFDQDMEKFFNDSGI